MEEQFKIGQGRKMKTKKKSEEGKNYNIYYCSYVRIYERETEKKKNEPTSLTSWMRSSNLLLLPLLLYCVPTWEKQRKAKRKIQLAWMCVCVCVCARARFLT